MTLAPLATRAAFGLAAPVTAVDVATLLGISCDAAAELCASVPPLRVTRRGPPVWRWGSILEHLERRDPVPAQPPARLVLSAVEARRPGARR